MERRKPFCRAVTICALILALGTLAQAQYGGGAGEPNDPYLISTPEQMNAIGADPNDWDKHFKLMADLDLAAYTGTEFNLIGSDRSEPFRGTFDGNGHVIENFTYESEEGGDTGLFRFVYDPNAEIRNLGLVAPNVHIKGGNTSRSGRRGVGRNRVGALVGSLEYGTITGCYVRGGTVSGESAVGGLVGSIVGTGAWGANVENYGRVEGCYCTCRVEGGFYVGGLVGQSSGFITNCCVTGVITGGDWVGGLVGSGGNVTGCYADAVVTGDNHVGGLVGDAHTISNCYAQGVVMGDDYVGGLAGSAGSVTNCYATAAVLADWYVGGLIGDGDQDEIVASFWDVHTSRQQSSAGGVGKTTAQMQRLATFLVWGEGDNAGIWMIDEGNDYPRLAWEGWPGILIAPLALSDLAGTGTADDPYLIYRVDEMEVIANEPNEWGKHFKLMADLDLGGCPGVDFNGGSSGGYDFAGVFDGNGHTVSNFTYVAQERDYAGFFGSIQNVPCGRGDVDCDSITPATIKNLGLVTPVIDGRLANCAGALVGYLSSGTVSNCYVEGGLVLGAIEETGGLVGYNCGTVLQCYALGVTVIGASYTGGLVGTNSGDIAECYSTAITVGSSYVGGLVGSSAGSVTNCYSAGAVTGKGIIGGLVGNVKGSVVNCYSVGTVIGEQDAGGLAGGRRWGDTIASFWNIETSRSATSDGSVGLTTAEMQTAAPFLAAGWDFVGEAENGAEEIWWIDEGRDTPRLWWERPEGEF